MKKDEKASFLIRNKAEIVSLFLCLAALIVALLLHPAYETNDDAIMESLLYGYHGMKGTSFLVFLNRLLGCILYFFASVFQYVNWYFVMHYSVCLSSLFVLSRTLIRKFGLNGFFASLLIVVAGMETLYSVQFTKTAALAAVAGGFGLLHSLREKKEWFVKCLCIGLIVISSMIRFESFLMVCPFLGIAGLYELIEMLKTKKENIKRYVVVLGITLFLFGTCYIAGNVINKNTPGASEFYLYNGYRASLTDHPTEVNSESSLIDMSMVSSWMNNDPQVFTLEKMKELNDLHHRDYKYFSAEALRSLFDKYFPKTIISEPMLLIALVEIACFLAFSKRRLYILFISGFYFVLEWYLSSFGRTGVHRVDFGILFAVIFSLIYLSDVSMPKIREDFKKLINYGVVPVITVLGMIIVCNYTFNWHISDRLYFKGVKDSLKKATANAECQYMVHPLALQFSKERNIYDLPTDQYNDGFFYMGGWQDGITIPGLRLPAPCDIAGNPWEVCVDSNSIKLVFPKANGETAMKVATLYIEAHYGKKCEGLLEYQDGNVLVYSIVSSK